MRTEASPRTRAALGQGNGEDLEVEDGKHDIADESFNGKDGG